MSTISAVELHQLLRDHPTQSVIDVRTPVEYTEVHVEAAKNVPLNQLKPDELHETYGFSIEKPIYILCHSGQRASRAAEQLTQSNFPNVVVVEGGTQAWIKAGFPVKRGNAKVISLERQVRIGAGLLVLTGLTLGWFVHPGFLGISAFVGAGLTFAGITDWCGMGLLLAKAPWNNKPQ